MTTLEKPDEKSLNALKSNSNFNISYADMILQNKDRILLYNDFSCLKSKSLHRATKLAFMCFVRFCEKTDKSQLQKIKELSEKGEQSGNYYELVKLSQEYMRDYLGKNIDTLGIDKVDMVVPSKEGFKNAMGNIDYHLKKIEERHNKNEIISLDDMPSISFTLQENFSLALRAIKLDMEDIVEFIEISEKNKGKDVMTVIQEMENNKKNNQDQSESLKNQL